MAEEKTTGLSSGQLKIDFAGATWNFDNTGSREAYFFREGKQMVLKAKQTFKGQKKGLAAQKRAILKQLKDQLKIDLQGATAAEKRTIRKAYRSDVKDLNTEYKADLKELQVIRKEAINAGKALTQERLISGYRPAVPDETEATPFVSEYAEEIASLEKQTDAVAEGIVSAETLTQDVMEGFENLSATLTGTDAFASVSQDLAPILEQIQSTSKKFGDLAQGILTDTTAETSPAELDLTIKQEDEKQENLVDLADMQIEATKPVVDKQVEQVEEAPTAAQPEAPVAEEPAPTVPVEPASVEEPLKIEPPSQDVITREFLDLLKAGQDAETLSRDREYDLMISRQEAEDIRRDKEYDLRREELGIRQAAIEQQERFAQEQRNIAAQSYENQLASFRNQARMNLTPNLQIQPEAQGQNIGGTSMFKRTPKKEEIIPKNTLGITQQSETNSLNIV